MSEVSETLHRQREDGSGKANVIVVEGLDKMADEVVRAGGYVRGSHDYLLSLLTGVSFLLDSEAPASPLVTCLLPFFLPSKFAGIRYIMPNSILSFSQH